MVYRFSDLQPKVANTRPMLSRDFAEKLLQRVHDSDKFDSIRVDDGVPTERTLFTAGWPKEPKGNHLKFFAACVRVLANTG